MSLFSELRRRNVIKVALLYSVASWLLVWIVSHLVSGVGLSPWVSDYVLLLLAIGFPVALIFAWTYEITPAGLSKAMDVEATVYYLGQGLRVLRPDAAAELKIGSFPTLAETIERSLAMPSPAQADLRVRAMAYLARDELAEATEALEGALALGGPLDDTLRREIASLKSQLAARARREAARKGKLP